MSREAMRNWGLGGAGGGGVPSGISPRMRASEGRGTGAESWDARAGSSWDRTNAIAANAASNTSGDVFMGRLVREKSFLVDGELISRQ